MNRTKLIYFYALAFVFGLSCQTGGEIIEFPAGPPALTATINGEAFSVDSLLVSANYSKIDARLQTLSISGAPPAFDGIVEGIALSVISIDSTDILSGESYVAGSLSKVGAGEYFIKEGSSIMQAYSDNTDIATITITEIDYQNKVVSGTFSFDAFDEDEPTQIYQIREGTFTHVSFD